MMCSTFRLSGFIIGNESRATALSVGSCALCSGAVARLVGVYIGLVLAYGGLGLSKSYVGIDAVKNILTRRRDCIGTAPFLLRRIHLESSREVDAAIFRYRRW